MNKELNDNEDKRLMVASVYFNLYMDTLEEFVDFVGDIYFREFGDEYAKVCIVKEDSICWVAKSFWDEFSEEFSLQKNEVQSIINKWVEDTYYLKGIHTWSTTLKLINRS